MGSNGAAVPVYAGLGAGQAFAIGLRAMLCSKFGPLCCVGKRCFDLPRMQVFNQMNGNALRFFGHFLTSRCEGVKETGLFPNSGIHPWTCYDTVRRFHHTCILLYSTLHTSASSCFFPPFTVLWPYNISLIRFNGTYIFPCRMKIFLYTLIRDLEFSVDEGMVIEKVFNIVARPIGKPASQTLIAVASPKRMAAALPSKTGLPPLSNTMPLFIRCAGEVGEVSE